MSISANVNTQQENHETIYASLFTSKLKQADCEIVIRMERFVQRHSGMMCKCYVIPLSRKVEDKWIEGKNCLSREKIFIVDKGNESCEKYYFNYVFSCYCTYKDFALIDPICNFPSLFFLSVPKSKPTDKNRAKTQKFM